jgi:ankyrin repeat protein
MKKGVAILILIIICVSNSINSQENITPEQKRQQVNSNLIEAIRNNNLTGVKTAIANNAEINGRLYQLNSSEELPLFIAVSLGFKEIVKYLIKKGAYINRLGDNYQTVMQIAKEKQNNKIIKILKKESNARYQLNYELAAEVNPLSKDNSYPASYRHKTNLKALKRLVAISSLDVFAYYSGGLCYPDLDNQDYIPTDTQGNEQMPNLNKLYDTPLKRLIFRRSEDYKEKLRKLKKLRKLLINKDFFINISRNTNYSITKSLTKKIRFKTHYNLTRKQFELILGSRKITIKALGIIARNPENRIPSTTMLIENGIGLVFQPQFVFVKRIRTYFMILVDNLLLYHYFRVPERVALKIENNGLIKIYFKIKGIRVYKKLPADTGVGDNITCVITYANRIEITDKTTGQMLYKKQF